MFYCHNLFEYTSLWSPELPPSESRAQYYTSSILLTTYAMYKKYVVKMLISKD